MTWQLTGEYLENCNCDVLCPCITSSLQGPADNDRCVVPLAMHITADSDFSSLGDRHIHNRWKFAKNFKHLQHDAEQVSATDGQ